MGVRAETHLIFREPLGGRASSFWPTAWAAVTAVSLAAGCGGYRSRLPGGDEPLDPEEDCADADGDGYGTGNDCLGQDCNDLAAEVHEGCDRWCDEQGPGTPGCPCDALEPALCYQGPAGTGESGECRHGLAQCADGRWGPCERQTLPTDEICNERDDDCDGVADDGVANACGDCAPDCSEVCVGAGCPEPLSEGDGAGGVIATDDGGVTLDDDLAAMAHVIWIANSSEGTVSKIDTRTREETGRYRTSADAGWLPSPSRTSVNLHGDVVVANRGTGGEATKFWAVDCPDADGDGRVDTSTGADDVYEFGEDECLAWQTPVASGARGTAFELRPGLDAAVEEIVWVGAYGTMRIYELDGETGEKTGREIGSVQPYGVAMGPDDRLWTFNGGFGGGTALLEVTTTDEDLEPTIHSLPAGESWYGITVDSVGRVWVGGSVARYDPTTDEWESPDLAVRVGGVACDAEGNAYMGEDPGEGWGGTGGYRIDAETLEVTNIPDAGGHGWAVDLDGFVWAVPFVGSMAYVIDPESLEVETTVEGLVGAYTYSDMTGVQLRNAAAPTGTVSTVFEGCEGVRWVTLGWEADLPEGTSLLFTIRTANLESGLAGATAVEMGSVPPAAVPFDIATTLADLDIEPETFLQVDVRLVSEARDASPTLHSVSVLRSCP